MPTNYLLSSYTSAIRAEGGWLPGSYGGYDSSFSLWTTCVLRFKATTTTIGGWIYRQGFTIALTIDGVYSSTFTEPNDAVWNDTTMFSSLDGAHEHEYQLVFGLQNQFVSYITVDSLNTGSLTAHLPLAFYGNSITAGTTGTGGDSSQSDAFKLAQILGLRIENRGINGTTVKNVSGSDTTSGEYRTADITGISPTPAMVWIRYGVNDSGQLKGTETTSDFQAAYISMMTTLTAAMTSTIFYCENIPPTASGSGFPNPVTGGWNTAVANAVASVNTTNGNSHCVLVNMQLILSSPYSYDPTASVGTSDGTHPNAAGYTIFTSFESAILSPPVTRVRRNQYLRSGSRGAA